MEDLQLGTPRKSLLGLSEQQSFPPLASVFLSLFYIRTYYSAECSPAAMVCIIYIYAACPTK